MSSARTLKLTTQGQLQLFDFDNSNKLAVKAPTNVSADYTITMPSAITAGYLKFDGSGNASIDAGTSSSVSMDAAYNTGRIVSVDLTPDNPVKFQAASPYVGAVFAVEQGGAGTAVTIATTATATDAGLQVTMDAAVNAPAIRITQGNGGDALVALLADVRCENYFSVGGGGLSMDNNNAIKARDTGGVDYHKILSLDATNTVRVGTDTGAYPLSLRVAGTEVARLVSGFLDVPNGTVVARSVTEAATNTAALYLAAGAAGAGVGASVLMGSVKATIKQATPSTLKTALSLEVNSGDTISQALYIHETGKVALGIGAGTSPTAGLYVFASGFAGAIIQHQSGDSHSCLGVVQNADFAALEVDKVGSGVGSAILISNSGTGLDIEGTGATWGVSKDGAAAFNAVTIDTIAILGARTLTPDGVITAAHNSIYLNLDADSGDPIGWVCTSDPTGSVWKGFGTIA